MTAEPDPMQAAWTFVTGFYARPGVANACLCLQDEAGVDVVELLMLLYAALELKAPLSAAEQTDFRKHMQSWRSTAVLPLRAIRRGLKPSRQDVPDAGREALRNEVKRAELTAERLQIGLAAGWLAARTGGDGLPFPETLARLLSADKQKQAAVADACGTILRALGSRTAG